MRRMAPPWSVLRVVLKEAYLLLPSNPVLLLPVQPQQQATRPVLTGPCPAIVAGAWSSNVHLISYAFHHDPHNNPRADARAVDPHLSNSLYMMTDNIDDTLR